MENKTLRYGIALIMGLALLSLTMQAGEQQDDATESSILDRLKGIWAPVAEKVKETVNKTTERLEPIGEKLEERLTQRFIETVDLASTKAFDALDKKLDEALGKDTVLITPDMIKTASGAFIDLQSVIGAIDPKIVATALADLKQIGTSLADLRQIGTSASSIALSPFKFTNAIIQLNESVTSLAKIEQIKRAIDAVDKLMKDVVEQSVPLFDKTYDIASKVGQFDKQTNDAIAEIREKIQEQLAPILNK